VLQGTAGILAPGGTLVLEFANKRNLKAMLRYVVGRQTWSPWDREPVEFVELNVDFHPAWVEERLQEAGLKVRERRAVSMFRLGLLKRLLPTPVLVALDRLAQPVGGLAPVSPSVFVRCEVAGNGKRAEEEKFFRCPACGSTALGEGENRIACESCGAAFAIRDGIYDFPEPAEAGDLGVGARNG
jgi:ribosomal protein S27AE